MGRNLLPRLKQAPNPANIPQAKIAEWTPIHTPGDLAKLDFGTQKDDDIRTRIQSIPSPWARMLLFRTALEDVEHPARKLVENELLDAFQFLWSLNDRPNAVPTYQMIRFSDLEAYGQSGPSQRTEWLARSLTELLPRKEGVNQPALEAITLVSVGGQPIIATSPYTVLFTAEDAALVPDSATDRFFRYATGSAGLTLAQRPFAFQRYVSQVLFPQLESSDGLRHQNTDAQMVQRLLRRWLQDEVTACRRAAGEARKAELESPTAGWGAAAQVLDLVPVTQLTGGIQLFARKAGAEMQDSRWVLRPTRSGIARPPLVLDPSQFDGQYAPGSRTITLPSDLLASDRSTLPGTGTHYPWVAPLEDWFADKLLLLAEPLELERVYGYTGYKSLYSGAREGLREAQLALPLKREVLRYFTPEDLDDRLSIEVQPTGQVDVSLRLPVGPNGREITIRRRYDDSAIQHGVTGPALTIWPRFKSTKWRDYTLFRRDQNAGVAQYVSMRASVGGELIAEQSERRNAIATVSAFEEAPDALELVSVITGGGAPARLGLIMPRYAAARSSVQEQWHVGVDFGTSNTVVSLRPSSTNAPQIFHVDDLTLPLTRASSETVALLDAYFLPHTIKGAPFGTAAVHFHELPTLNIHQEPIGVRVNVPFNGNVEPDPKNRVTGDLKWSSDANQRFLSGSFLRHLLAVVLAQAVQRGVDPKRVQVVWAHPRAFTPAQVNQLREQWSQVHDYFDARLGGVGPMSEALDESRAVLRFFFNDAAVTAVGDVNVIVDVGGGTSDIAIYGHGEALALDSVTLGGRNLTGQRDRAGAFERQRNVFVGRFADWAKQNQLSDYPLEKRAVEKYLADGQDHLAFSYLLRSQWFKQHGQPFSGDSACEQFQCLVLYFFGSLFYYVGLSLRGIADGDSKRYAPSTVMLAGNGSQYVRWLTDLTSSPLGGFGKAFGMLLLEGMHSTESADVAAIRLTTDPKLEVALGLVAGVPPRGISEARTESRPLSGEQFSARMGQDGLSRQFTSTSRLANGDLLAPEHIASLQWAEGKMEIERYNEAFLRVMQSLGGHGQQWVNNMQSTRSFFSKLSRRDLEQATRAQLQILASATSGFRGSLFVLEATTVLGLMTDHFFVSSGYTAPLTATGASSRV